MIYLTLLLVTAAAATPLLGREQCAHGPPYWCQNVKTASTCGAVSHCQQNVWNKPQVKSVPCDLCKEVITVVDQLLKDNETQSEVLGYLEKACELIPDKGISSECRDMVDSYYPILIDIITGELDDPAVVCGALGVCQSQQRALGSAQLLSNEIPQVDLAQRASPFLLNVPQLLYPQDAPKQEVPEQEAPKKINDEVCKNCLQFISSVQEEAKKNETFVEAVITQMEKECDLLGPGFADTCKQYISMYGGLIFQQLLSMQAQDICSAAGFCPSVHHSVPMETLVAAKLLPIGRLLPSKLEPPAEVKAAELTPAKEMMVVKDSPTCTICEAVMQELENLLKDEATEEEIIKAVEKVCMIVPSRYRDQCKDLVDTYGQAIIDLLVQEADPKTVCTVLGLCGSSRGTFIPVLNQAKFGQGGFCEVCEMAVRYIDGILEDNSTEAQIKDAAEKVCNFLPDSIQTECHQLIDQYEPMLVALLMQALDPEFVCTKMGACPEVRAVDNNLLGTEECSWGPAFWCKSLETASRCNAVDHCRRHVWN